MKDDPAGATFDACESGWMEIEKFYSWFKISFLPSFKDKDGWKCLIFDAHRPHISLELIQLALDRKLVLIVLPPHTTHLLQPLDGPVFKNTMLVW